MCAFCRVSKAPKGWLLPEIFVPKATSVNKGSRSRLWIRTSVACAPNAQRQIPLSLTFLQNPGALYIGACKQSAQSGLVT